MTHTPAHVVPRIRSPSVAGSGRQAATTSRGETATGQAAAHPDTWTNPKPIGTGPYLMGTCGPNNIEYTANPAYWQAGKPYIQKVEYPAYLDNAPANNDLASGNLTPAASGRKVTPNG